MGNPIQDSKTSAARLGTADLKGPKGDRHMTGGNANDCARPRKGNLDCLRFPSICDCAVVLMRSELVVRPDWLLPLSVVRPLDRLDRFVGK